MTMNIAREDTTPGDPAPLAPVESLHPSSLIQIPGDDHELVQAVMRDVEMLQTALGADRERHANELQRLEALLKAEQRRGFDEEKKLLSALSAARKKYKDLVNVLAEKHVKRPGKYDFRPEIGAFVAKRTGSEN